MKNKKKKQLPLLLLALLFITTAAYGTRAYFSDDASQDAGIKLTLGNLDIKEKSVVWEYTTAESKKNKKISVGVVEGTEIKNPADIQNVQPGDEFTGTFTFENTGTLDQVVTAVNTLETLNEGIVKFDVNDQILVTKPDGSKVAESNEVTAEPGQLIKIKVVATVGTTENDNTYNTIDKKVAVDAIEKTITVNAVQSN